VESLGLNTDTAELAAARAAQRKVKPGLAFAMSLLVPGSGQLYCGKRRGAVTMAFFAGAVLVALFVGGDGGNNVLLGVALRAAIVLYGFGFLDAYFTAREVNRGIDEWVDGANPRVAAVLNLVTTGFGYFYLGQKAKGLIIFFALKVLGVAIASGHGKTATILSIVSEIVLAVLAFDAWRLAREEQKHDKAWDVADGVTPAADIPDTQEGLGPALPIALSGLMVLNYVLLVAVGVALPDYRKIDQSTTVITPMQDGAQEYRNAQYKVAATIGPSWVLVPSSGAPAFFEAEHMNGGCSLTFIPQAELWNSMSTGELLLRELRQKFPKTQLMSERDGTLGGRKSHASSFAIDINGAQLRQRYTSVRKGLTTYVLIETVPATWDGCDADLESMVKSVKWE